MDHTKHWNIYCAICSTLLFCVFGWDAIAHGGVIGFEGAEIWAFVWGHHWMHLSLSDFSWPYDTQLLDYPNGGVLWLKDPIMLVLMHPFRMIFGIPFAVLFSQYLLFLLASMSVFWICRHHRLPRRCAHLDRVAALAAIWDNHLEARHYSDRQQNNAHGDAELRSYIYQNLHIYVYLD